LGVGWGVRGGGGGGPRGNQRLHVCVRGMGMGGVQPPASQSPSLQPVPAPLAKPGVLVGGVTCEPFCMEGGSDLL
jgi:hypothetical protein